MANRGRSTSPRRQPTHDDDDHFINTRPLEQFGRTVHATATQLLSANFPHPPDSPNANHSADPYRSALSSLHRSVRRPLTQRSVFSLARTSPRELLRSQFSAGEIEQRALSYIPEELLRSAPEGASAFSLFEGFQASLPEEDAEVKVGRRKKHGRKGSKGQKALEGVGEEGEGEKLGRVRREKGRAEHRLEMMGVRKTMCASEIREIDGKVGRLQALRKVALERLAGLETEERDLEVEVGELQERMEEMLEGMEDAAALVGTSPRLDAVKEEAGREETEEVDGDETPGFMSESVYEKLPKAKDSPRSKRRAGQRMPRRKVSMPVLHEHMEPGSRIREIPAHTDAVTALDFDAPFGTLVTAGLDDTVRVWDLNAGRCLGMLEGHLSSVRCLQVEDQLVATGSMDASIRLWDLSQADYSPPPTSSEEEEANPSSNNTDDNDNNDDLFTTPSHPPPTAPTAPALANCHVHTLSAHVAEVTALHLHNTTLVSGSADKTLRQWDLERGRCIQTLDVLWAAAQAHSNLAPPSALSTTNLSNPSSLDTFGSGRGSGDFYPRPRSSQPTSSSSTASVGGGVGAAVAPFVGAIQVFESALACGTADGMVRLWDLRSGLVHRSLVGHTGPVTALKFDEQVLVTASGDRSVRIWDLRTGTIRDAYAYANPITSMQFDARLIVSAAGEDVVKVYDRVEGSQWDIGAGAAAAAAAVEAGEAGDGGGGGAGSRWGIVEQVRLKEGFLVEGRRDGGVGVWSC